MEIKDLQEIELIIAPSDLHGAILRYKNKHPNLNFKIIDKEFVLEECYGRSSLSAMGYLIKHHNLSFENARAINRFINRGNINHQHEKIKYLGILKEQLIQNKLFEVSQYFRYELSKKSVLIIGYGQDLELINIVSSIAKSVKVIPFIKGELLPNVYKFKTINEEVFYIFNEVCRLVESELSIDDILIVAKGEEYQIAINKMCDFFSWAHAIDVKTPLLANESIQEELKKIQQGTLKDYLNSTPNSLITSLVTKYGLEILSEKEALNALYEILKHEQSMIKGRLNLKVSASMPFVNQYKKVFLLGFNQGIYPVVKKDDEYLSDQLKLSLNMLSSKNENYINKMRIIDFITNQEGLVITYKINAGNTSFYPSSLVQELGLNIVEPEPQEYIYSKKYLELVLASQMDLKRIYGEVSKSLLMYQNSLQIPYKTFNYQFNGVLQVIEHQKRNYSYSRIKTFFECQFSYYCKHVLKLDSFESSFATNYGSLAHRLLEHVYDENFDFENIFNQTIKDYNFNESELILLNRRKEDILHISQILREHHLEMKVKNIYAENKYTIDLDNNLTLSGIIDRIIITTDGINDYFTIIDYKSGEEKVDLDLVQFGYSMQLPIYALLLTTEYKLENFLGFYIQPLTLNKISIPTTNRLDFYKKHLKLQGFSSDNLKALETFDPSYNNSKYIKSLRLKNDGTFYHYAKVLTTDEIKRIVDLAKEQVIEADKKIISGQFEINPKIVKKVSACKFCPFSDVCFKDDEAFIYLSTKDGGEDDVD